MQILPVKISPVHIGFLMIFLFVIQFTSAQNVDTIKINITNRVYDTVIIYDTVVNYDTVWLDSGFKEINIGVSASSFICKWRKNNDKISTVIRQQNYSAGIDAGIVFNKFVLRSGLFYTQFKEIRQIGYSLTDIDSVVNLQLIPHSYFSVDTIVTWQYFTYDTTFNDSTTVTIIDSIQQYQIDSTEINYNDTVYNTVYDTITKDTAATANFKYTYLEVPLILKYRLGEYRNFIFDIGAGFIAGFLIKSESYFFDVGTNTVKSYAKSDTYRFMPSLWFSLGINYKIGDVFLISLEPYYNPGLKSIYKKELSVIKIPDRYGLRFGVRYYF